MKNLIVGIGFLSLLLMSCQPDPNTNPNVNHFKMTVNGTELSCDPNNVVHFYYATDSSYGIYANGGTVIYNAIELHHCYQPGTYPLVGDYHAGTGGLRYQTVDSIYYIDTYHGSGSVVINTFNVSPGVINEMRGTFSGTAATDNGHTVTITGGDYYYKHP